MQEEQQKKNVLFSIIFFSSPDETTSLLNICSRTLPFALPNSSDQSKEGGQANILSQGNVSFADSEVEDVLNSDEFEAAFGNNNCAPSGRITFPETQSPVHDAALEEEIDYGVRIFFYATKIKFYFNCKIVLAVGHSDY